MKSAFARMVAFVACVVLLTSRAMLVLHEFVGHGAAAMLFGGRITGWYLFLFAGGRVSYETPPLGPGPRLVITLGGIALEIAIGAVAFLLARRLREKKLVAFGASCVGTALVGHGAVYLARGVHYGFGDGALSARLLGDARVVVVVVAGALATAAAAYGGRSLAELPSGVFLGTRARIASMACLVFVCAGIVHGTLAWSEIRWFPDAGWARIMEDASVVTARAEVARRIAEAERRGEAPPSATERDRQVDALERERRPWPLDPVLAIALLAGLAAGVVRGARPGTRLPPPSGRAIGLVATGLAVMIVVIVVLRQSAPS